MRFNPFAATEKSNFDRYLFYRGLGYSVPAAEVLSRLTYGNRESVLYAKQFPIENRLQMMYACMTERKTGKPGQAPASDPETECLVDENCLSREWPEYLESEEAADSVYTVDAEAADFGNNRSSIPKAKILRSRRFDAAKRIAAESDLSAGEANLSFDLLASVPLYSTTIDGYEPIEEKNARSVFTAPTSTFRMTTSTASIGILFNQLRSGRRIRMDQVRIEELLNYFDYASEIPSDAKFRIQTELLPKSVNKKLLYINVQACEEQREHQNIVVLLDVSGSMSGNAEVTQATVATILSKLHAGDTFSLVTYSDRDHTVIDGYQICDDQDKEILMGYLMGLEIDGCTYGSAGIKTAYELGAKHYHDGWSNQVMLITDGDLNFGITDKGGLRELIEDKKRSGLFLSVIGTGLWNYQDEKLEVLSKHGNGTYCVVNDLKDVEESIDHRYIALTNIIAKDVKAQLEFNPRFVKSYRLLGYENREIAHVDFADDTVISEPYGSGGHGVALYELEMGNGGEQTALKYQTPLLTDSDELCTVKIRYKEPLADVSHEIESVVYDQAAGTKNTELAWFIYCVSEKLRGSDKLDAEDEAFLEKMLADGKYKELTEHDAEKLTLFVEAMLLNLQ